MSKSATLRLQASTTLTVECANPCPTVAMLRPRSGAAQWVVAERYEVTPWLPVKEYTDAYGNLCQRMSLPAGRSTINVWSEVEVEARLAVDPSAPILPVEALPDDTLIYLLQSRYCPSDKMNERAASIVGDAPATYAQVERIRRWIRDNHEYRYGVSSASTDALETISAGAGVCRDFAHVGVALCRSLTIPARIVVGYLHELDPMDLHAWFEAFIGGRWYTFDATQDKPRGGRIAVAYGRDVADVAFLSNYGEMEIADMEVSVKSL